MSADRLHPCSEGPDDCSACAAVCQMREKPYQETDQSCRDADGGCGDCHKCPGNAERPERITDDPRAYCVNASTACPRPCPEECSSWADRASAPELLTFEDCACGRPCGAEPMGCATCDELHGRQDGLESEPDEFAIEERDDPCSRCYNPCDYCTLPECVLGPDLSDRPDYEHLRAESFDPETGLYPMLHLMQRDYWNAAKHCGLERFCDNPEVHCPIYNGTFDAE